MNAKNYKSQELKEPNKGIKLNDKQGIKADTSIKKDDKNKTVNQSQPDDPELYKLSRINLKSLIGI
jgi:hypothetical protein